MVSPVEKRDDNIFKQKIKKKGFWNYEELYNFCYGWFDDLEYFVLESMYKEVVTDFGKEILITWTANKKVTDYFKFVIKLDWHILGMNSAEVEEAGKKIKTNKGEVKINIKADLKRDYTGKWNKQSIFGSLRNIYEGQVIRASIDEYEDRLAEDVSDFVSELKEFLELI